jgi:hypothetical protein
MFEITVIHKADPELLAKLDKLCDAVAAIRTGYSPPEALYQPTPTPAEKVAKKGGAKPKADAPPAPEPPPTLVESLPAEAKELPDYDSIKTELRDLMTKGMAIDATNKNKEMREKMKEIFRNLDENCDGKLSGLPDEKLEQALALVKHLIVK